MEDMNNDNTTTATFSQQEIMMVDFALAYCANKGIYSADGLALVSTILAKMGQDSSVEGARY